jgi:PKD repeat protein
MSKIRSVGRTFAAALICLSLAGVGLIEAGAASADRASGVGSCTLKNFDPADAGIDANLPEGHRHQTYRPDDYSCTGAKFAKVGSEFRRFPQPKSFHIISNRHVAAPIRVCVHRFFCYWRKTPVWRPVARTAAAINPLAPYFPPFTHFVIIFRENHTFDDYLGDCQSTVAAPGETCNGQVESTNHISSVPNLHTLAKTYGLSDSYSTGTQPPSGPNHWWLFSGQSSSSSQQQSYPTAGGTVFDRFLGGTSVASPGEGTSVCSGTAGTAAATGSSPYTFVMNGDFYWMLNAGGGYWRNPGTGNPEVLPVDRPGTSIPEELTYNNYTCNGQNDDDQTIANGFTNFVSTNGLPAYSYVELFNDHPGTFQNILENDSATNSIVTSLMNNATYKNNTLIIVTEDDTQNGNNGPDHVSNTYRVPLVVIGSPTYVKANYISHVAYTTSNVLAAMERVMQNVHSGIIDPNNNLGLSTFPMTTADQAALADPLDDFWVQGATPLSASATGTPTNGNAPLSVNFTGSATGGTAPYSYSWNFGDGSAGSTAQNPSHTYSAGGTYTATLTVTDAASPTHTATSTVAVNVNAVGNPLQATASASPTSGQIPLTVAFSGTGTGGTPPYSYSWNFGDGSGTSTAQNPGDTYNNAGTYNATLTVTDAAAPAHTATSTVAITASPIAGTAPGAPTGLAATAGTGQVSLSWTAPSSNGGVNITSYRVYRGTSSGSETLLTSGGCSSLGAVLSCTDAGLTAGTTYFYKVSAVNAIGEGPQSNEASATPTASTCTAAQLLGNPGFETGNASPWTATSGVINNSSSEPPHSGSWDAWLDGYGTTHTDTLSQSVTIPAGCTGSTLSFWLHIDTAETGTTAHDTLQVQLLNSSGSVLTTLATYSNLNAASGYVQKSFSVGAYAGQAVTLKLTGSENSSLQTSFVVDDFALNTSGSGGGNTVTVTNPGSQLGTVGTPASLQIQASDSASGQTLTYSATGLPAGLSINSSSGLISGTPTTSGTSSVTVTATDTTGAHGSTTFTWTINPASGGCTAAQLLGNPGFETGSASPWTSTSGVINSSSSEPPHSGSWDAWLDGYGTTHTDTLAQTVSIPSTCKAATLSFWLHIDTAETTTTTAYDTLAVQILDSSGAVLSTLHTYSNLDHATGYVQHSFDLSPFIGQTITLKFTGSEDYTMQTSFVIDDTAINVS